MPRHTPFPLPLVLVGEEVLKDVPIRRVLGSLGATVPNPGPRVRFAAPTIETDVSTARPTPCVIPLGHPTTRTVCVRWMGECGGGGRFMDEREMSILLLTASPVPSTPAGAGLNVLQLYSPPPARPLKVLNETMSSSCLSTRIACPKEWLFCITVFVKLQSKELSEEWLQNIEKGSPRECRRWACSVAHFPLYTMPAGVISGVWPR